MRKLSFLLLLSVFCSCFSVSAQWNKRYFYYTGIWNINEKKHDQALEAFNRLLNSDYNDYEAYLYRAIAKANLGDLLGAESDLTKALEINPVYTQAYQYRARIRTQIGNYADASADYQSAIDIRPDLAETFYHRAVSYFLTKDYENAKDDFTRFLRHSNRAMEQRTEFGMHLESDAFVNRGECYLHLGDTMKAITDFTAAIKTNPYSPRGYFYRGAINLELEKYPEATEDLQKSIQADSLFLSGYFSLAILYNQTKKPVQAIDNLSKIVEIDSTISVAYFNRALVRSDIGDYNNALKDYDIVIKLNPDNVLVYYNRALLYTYLGDYGAAIRDYSRAIELYPDFSNAYLQRANLKYMLNDMKGSRQDVNTAEKKIAEYKSRLKDGGLSTSEYADTSKRFNQLISFEPNRKSLAAVALSAGNNMSSSLAPMYRFDLVHSDSVPRLEESYFGRYKEFIDEVNNPYLHLSSKTINLPIDSLSNIEARLKQDIENGNREWKLLFEHGVALSLIKQYSNSINTLTLAIDKMPANPFLYLARSSVRTEMIEFIASMENSLSSTTLNDELFNSSTTQYNYDEAIADLNKAAKLYPEFAYTYYNRGRLQMLSGRMVEAYEDFSKAIENNPLLAEAYFNRGISQIYLQEIQKGCLDISKAGELGMKEAYTILKHYTN